MSCCRLKDWMECYIRTNYVQSLGLGFWTKIEWNVTCLTEWVFVHKNHYYELLWAQRLINWVSGQPFMYKVYFFRIWHISCCILFHICFTIHILGGIMFRNLKSFSHSITFIWNINNFLMVFQIWFLLH